MKHSTSLAILGLFFVSILMLSSGIVSAACEIVPYGGTAVIDGDNSEWDHTNTMATEEMYQAWWRPGDPGSMPLLSKFWMRYDCIDNVMYVLVMAEYKIVVEEDPDDEQVLIKLDGKIVIAPNPDPPKQFAWVGSDGTYADGWEASFPLGEGTYDFTMIHNNALDSEDEKQTAGLRDVEMCIDCDVISVELTSFEAYTCDQGIRIEWEVASEIDHAGYNVYRGESKDGEFIKINESLIVSTGVAAAGQYEFIDVGARGEHYYQLENVSLDGRGTLHGPIQVSGITDVAKNIDVPNAYSLSANYPNPFNPSTSISYALPVESEMQLYIYDVQGKLVKRLVNGIQTAGIHTVTWVGLNNSGEPVQSGIFIYRMTAGDFQKTGRMTLLR